MNMLHDCRVVREGNARKGLEDVANERGDDLSCLRGGWGGRRASSGRDGVSLYGGHLSLMKYPIEIHLLANSLLLQLDHRVVASVRTLTRGTNLHRYQTCREENHGLMILGCEARRKPSSQLVACPCVGCVDGRTNQQERSRHRRSERLRRCQQGLVWSGLRCR